MSPLYQILIVILEGELPGPGTFGRVFTSNDVGRGTPPVHYESVESIKELKKGRKKERKKERKRERTNERTTE